MPTIYIDVDSSRPDHLGCYGYDRPTSPEIDRFADDALRFDRAYVANSPCMPSRAAWLSGRHGIHNGIETHGGASQVLNGPQWGRLDGSAEAYRTTPELFFGERVPTVAVSSFPRHPSPWFYHLWHEFHQPQEPDAEGEYFQTPRAAEVADRAIDALERHDDDLFLYVQFWDPHAPYNRTDEQVDRFDDGDAPTHPTAGQIEAHREWDAWRSATGMGIEDRSDLGRLVAGYDAEISYCDRHVGRLLDALREQGRYEESTIVLTADHGEEFGEHGLYREHWSVHDGTQNVPLLVKPPAGAGVDAGATDALVTNVDLPPTLADYAGLGAPEGWQGRSLRPVIERGGDGWRDRIVVDHGLYTAQRAVRTDRWKFVRTYNPGMWGGVVPDRQLFDMDDDPWEQTDVAADHPEVVAELEREMAAWVETHAGDQEDALKRVAREGPAGADRGGYEGV